MNKQELIQATDTIMQRLMDYAEESQGAYSENSQAARLNDLKVYAEFCALHDLAGFPATGKQTAQFIDWMREEKKWKLTTIRRRLTTLATYHQAANLNDPTRDGQHVKLALRKITQSKPEPQKQAEPLQYKDLKKIIQSIDNDTDPENAAARARDKAILLLAYDTMLRRSELAAVKANDFKATQDGFYLDAPFTKTNKGQRIDNRFVSTGTMQAINSMMALIPPLSDGRIFRQIRHGKIGDAISDQGIYHVIKTRSGGRFSGHSLRVGHAIDQRAAGLSLPEICQSGGWQSASMAMRYTASIDVEESGAAKLARKQRRA